MIYEQKSSAEEAVDMLVVAQVTVRGHEASPAPENHPHWAMKAVEC